MYDELKTKYPYITNEQWDKVDKGEAQYLDFLTPEDLQKHQDEVLAEQEAERRAQIQTIINGLNQVEQSPEAQMLLTIAHDEAENGKKRMKEFIGVDKYIDQSMRHSFIQYAPLRGLRVYTDGYTDSDGISNPGYNLRFEFLHESGLTFIKYVSGEGLRKENTEWEILINE